MASVTEPALADCSMEVCASRGGKPSPLDDAAVAKYLPQLCPTWRTIMHTAREGAAPVMALERTFDAKDFPAAMGYLNAIAAIAEECGHHPDFSLASYKTVTIRLYTFSVDGLTINDFISAARYDRVPVAMSRAWLAAHPECKAARL